MEEESFRIARFDSAIITLDTARLQESLTAAAKRFPQIYSAYFDDLLEIPSRDTVFTAAMIADLLADTLFAHINADVLSVFSDTRKMEKQLAFARAALQKYFPQIRLPEIYFFVSGCNRSVFSHDNLLGVGVDMYLGADYERYSNFAFIYDYMLPVMTPESIPIDVVAEILTKAFPFRSTKNRLIDNMLYCGRLLYMIDALLPEQSEENIGGYTAEQLAWCKKYERAVWATIIDRGDLFSTDQQIIGAYTLPAPFTQPVSQESPPRLGTWIGYQIVKAYVKNNPTVDLQTLAGETDFGKILEQSKYMP